jgi:putative intracellular protease/amidase
MQKHKALIVVTSISKYAKENIATGLWLGEAVHFYDKLVKAGWHVDFVSPKGGYTPIDPNSLKPEIMTEVDWHYYTDHKFLNLLGHTHKPSEIKADDYQCIYYAGGHGVIWDFPENQELQQIASHIYGKGGVVASVCHGAVGLFNIKDKDGNLIIKDKKLTGFSNEEEKLAGLDSHVPFLTETELVGKGANYVKAEKPFTEFAVEDKHIVTGQNPQSGGACGALVLQLIK